MERAREAAEEYAVQEALTHEELDRTYFMAEDETVKEIIDSKFPMLKPLHSRLHSLTYVEKGEAEKLKHTINSLSAVIEMFMDERSYDEKDHVLLLALTEHLKLRLNDSLKGRKLKALTQFTRIIEFRGERKRRFL